MHQGRWANLVEHQFARPENRQAPSVHNAPNGSHKATQRRSFVESSPSARCGAERPSSGLRKYRYPSPARSGLRTARAGTGSTRPGVNGSATFAMTCGICIELDADLGRRASLGIHGQAAREHRPLHPFRLEAVPAGRQRRVHGRDLMAVPRRETQGQGRSHRHYRSRGGNRLGDAGRRDHDRGEEPCRCPHVYRLDRHWTGDGNLCRAVLRGCDARQDQEARALPPPRSRIG